MKAEEGLIIHEDITFEKLNKLQAKYPERLEITNEMARIYDTEGMRDIPVSEEVLKGSEFPVIISNGEITSELLTLLVSINRNSKGQKNVIHIFGGTSKGLLNTLNKFYLLGKKYFCLSKSGLIFSNSPEDLKVDKKMIRKFTIIKY